jgi:catechol 2,3-dioxygenase-like lactoylglutathione lyase family enzyme
MTPVVRSMVASSYVADLDASRAFYELLGFREIRSGTAAAAAWSELSGSKYLILLVSTRPRLETPAVPLAFYFFYDDVENVRAALLAAGLEVEHVGYPDHARGGELRLKDPDGNTVLIGQRAASAADQAADARDLDDRRFSLLREAAAAAASRSTTMRCQVSSAGWLPCERTAEAKLADSAGDTVWACISHAEEILVSVPGAFVASQDQGGIASFLAAHHG